MEKQPDVLVKIVAYGHFKTICGFESIDLEVPGEGSLALKFVKSWLKSTYGINSHEVLLLLKQPSAIVSTPDPQQVEHGDTFLLLPLISGG